MEFFFIYGPYFKAPRHRATCFSYPSTFMTPGRRVSSYFYAPKELGNLLHCDVDSEQLPGSSADEFAFFPLAFFGGTMSTRLMAALLLTLDG
jgi:hypothetical protein